MDPRRGRARLGAGVHQVLVGHGGAGAVGRRSRAATGADSAAEMATAEHLRLGMLGPADGGAAHRGEPLSPRASSAFHTRRARPRFRHAEQTCTWQRTIVPPAGPRAPRIPGCARQAAATTRPARGGCLDHGASGGRRKLGRNPGAARLLDHRAVPARPTAQRPRARGGVARARRLCGQGRHPTGASAMDRELSRTGLGHRASHPRPTRRGDGG